jgi:SPP1 family predicted phage head-tail adaptor
MNAGRLDDKIELLEVVSSSMDIHGQVFPVYVSSSVWSNAESTAGDEQLIGGVDRIYSRYKFIIRKNPSVNEQTQIVYNNRTYNIVYIRDAFERKTYTEIIGELINNG